jgi:hypothetical protein
MPGSSAALLGGAYFEEGKTGNFYKPWRPACVNVKRSDPEQRFQEGTGEYQK